MSITVTRKVHFSTGLAGQKRLRKGTATKLPATCVPRISRLMALAIHFDQLIRERKVKDYADLARLGRVTRARVTQIMNLLLLAPDIQEEILFLGPTVSGRDAIKERDMRQVMALIGWRRQHRMWINCRLSSSIAFDHGPDHNCPNVRCYPHPVADRIRRSLGGGEAAAAGV
jgi:hypothetical protein